MQNNIRTYRQAQGWSQEKLAKLVGVGVPQISRWERGIVDIPSSRIRDLAMLLGASPSELLGVVGDAGRAAPYLLEPNATVVPLEGPSAERMRNDLPVYGTALAAVREVDGEAIEQTTLNTGEIVQYVRRPVLLNGNSSAYALYVAGSSMDPRFRDGEMVLADPKGRVRGGEDVVVYLRPRSIEMDDGDTARGVLVKTLVRRTASYLELEQFSPAKVFRIEMDEVVRVDRVIPWHEMLG